MRAKRIAVFRDTVNWLNEGQKGPYCRNWSSEKIRSAAPNADHELIRSDNKTSVTQIKIVDVLGP